MHTGKHLVSLLLFTPVFSQDVGTKRNVNSNLHRNPNQHRASGKRQSVANQRSV